MRDAALVVEGDHPLGRARLIGDDEADAWSELARMPLDFGGAGRTAPTPLATIQVSF
jgi:hypothetical protein